MCEQQRADRQTTTDERTIEQGQHDAGHVTPAYVTSPEPGGAHDPLGHALDPHPNWGNTSVTSTRRMMGTMDTASMAAWPTT